ENVAADAGDDARDDLALALDRAGHRDLARAGAPAPSAAALIPVPVLRLAADEGLVHLDDPHQLAEVLVSEAGADAVAHVPGGRVRPEPHVAVDLQRADPLLASQHKVDDAEPLTQRLIRILEDRPDDGRE